MPQDFRAAFGITADIYAAYNCSGTRSFFYFYTACRLIFTCRRIGRSGGSGAADNAIFFVRNQSCIVFFHNDFSYFHIAGIRIFYSANIHQQNFISRNNSVCKLQFCVGTIIKSKSFPLLSFQRKLRTCIGSQSTAKRSRDSV